MVDLEKINGKYAHAGPLSQFTETASRFASDFLELTELQAKLFKADTHSVLKQSLGAIAIAILGCLLLLGSLPVLVFGLASVVALYCQIDEWIAQLAVGGGFALLSLIFIAWSFRSLAKSSIHYQRSAAEFSKNIQWTKDVIRGVTEK